MRTAAVFTITRQLLSSIFCLLLITSNAQQSNSSNENASSRWLDKKIVVDGKAAEWIVSDFINDDKAGFSYHISNDSSFLYICLIIKDEMNKTKMLNAGFSIYLNNEGKKKKSYAIDYPLRDEENNLANNPEKMRDLKSMRFISFLHTRNFQLSGFKKTNGLFAVDAANDAGISISIGFDDSGEMIYETSIPFTSINMKPFALQTNDESNIAVCFSINALSKPTGQPPPQVVGGVSGNPQSAGKRFSNSNVPSGAPSGFGQMDMLFQSSKTWKVISLAKKP